jgi:hypothetical protein
MKVKTFYACNDHLSLEQQINDWISKTNPKEFTLKINSS